MGKDVGKSMAYLNGLQVRMITGRDNQTMQDVLKLISSLSVPLNLPQGPVGIIRAQGADAAKFLQGQLTQDVALLGLSEARLAAWCSAKGRMLASFVVFKNTPEDIVLLCASSVLPATLKRLQMFVMRAQCKLTDATGQFALHGVTGAAPGELPAWSLARQADMLTIGLPEGHYAGVCVPRILQMTPLLEGQPWVLDGEAVSAHNAALAAWQYLSVSTGIAHITTPVSEAFVPQMLNYESVGGVNFKKGCYPGQEVVARSQFRGTLKRRAYLVRSAAPLAAGQEVFDSRGTEQPCGTVAGTAHLTGGDHWLAIVSMQTSAADSPALTAGSAQGPALQLQALPYPLLDDI
jgi:tRNA-modifying protein YgfZ